MVELIYTSGTSGEPKAVMHTANTVLAPARCFIEDIPVAGSDVIFMGSPYAHQTGFLYGMLMPVMLATTTVALDAWSASEAAPMIEREGVTFSMGSTPFVSDMVNLRRGAARAREPDAAHLGVRGRADPARAGAAGQGRDEPRRAVLLGHDRERRPDHHRARAIRRRRCSRPTAGRCRAPRCAWWTTRKRPLPADTVGNLQARGITHFVGYLKKPQLNSIDADGWFDTGDLARMDKDGYIRIVGRTKDVIIRGGENIPVAEVENLIYRHPAVAECAVVAMPDERLGERPCAYVVAKAGARLDLAELTRFLAKEGMAKTYWPERLELVADMPRTPSGKIQKFKLREAAAKLGASLSPRKRAEGRAEAFTTARRATAARRPSMRRRERLRAPGAVASRPCRRTRRSLRLCCRWPRMRWHGMMTATGLRDIACPTARAAPGAGLRGPARHRSRSRPSRRGARAA